MEKNRNGLTPPVKTNTSEELQALEITQGRIRDPSSIRCANHITGAWRILQQGKAQQADVISHRRCREGKRLKGMKCHQPLAACPWNYLSLIPVSASRFTTSVTAPAPLTQACPPGPRSCSGSVGCSTTDDTQPGGTGLKTTANNQNVSKT